MSGPTIDVDGIEAAKAAAGPRAPDPAEDLLVVRPRAPSLEEVRELTASAREQSLARRARAHRNRRRRAVVEAAGVLVLLVAVLTLLGLL